MKPVSFDHARPSIADADHAIPAMSETCPYTIFFCRLSPPWQCIERGRPGARDRQCGGADEHGIQAVACRRSRPLARSNAPSEGECRYFSPLLFKNTPRFSSPAFKKRYLCGLSTFYYSQVRFQLVNCLHINVTDGILHISY